MDDTVTHVSAPRGQKQNLLSLTHIQMGRQVVVWLDVVHQDVVQQDVVWLDVVQQVVFWQVVVWPVVVRQDVVQQVVVYKGFLLLIKVSAGLEPGNLQQNQ